MSPYIPLCVGGVITVAVLILILTPTECFVMKNDASRPIFGMPQLDGLKVSFDKDGNWIYVKTPLTSLEESEIITVENPPKNALSAMLFWIIEGGATAPDPERGHVNYHVECTDAASQTIQWMFPSMFPNSMTEEEFARR